MQYVLRDLKRRRGVRLDSLDALEVFGETGGFHTRDYANRVKSLQVWEINPEQEEALCRNLPNATVRIVDS